MSVEPLTSRNDAEHSAQLAQSRTGPAGSERETLARSHGRLRRRIGLASYLWAGGYLLLWILLDLAAQAVELLPGGAQSHWALQLLLIAGLFGGGFWVWSAPFGYVQGHVLPRRFGLSAQSAAGFLADQVKSAVISAVLLLPILLALYGLLRLAGPWWWLWMAGLLAALALFTTFIAPVLLLPLFYRVRPLGDDQPALAGSIMELARSNGVHVMGVYRMQTSAKTTTANAALAGLGRTRRILLADNLLDHFDPEEVRAVVAHELAHHVHRDIPRLLSVNLVLAVLGLWAAAMAVNLLAPLTGAENAADPRAMPLLLAVLTLTGLLTAPLDTAVSRNREFAADRFACEVLGTGEPMARALERLASRNLAEVTPPAWTVLFASHPPIARRIARARGYRPEPAENGSAGPAPFRSASPGPTPTG